MGWPRDTETETEAEIKIEIEIEIEFKLNSKLKLKLNQKIKIQNKIDIFDWRLPFYARTCKVFVISRILNNIVELFAATLNKATIKIETTTNTRRENNKNTRAQFDFKQRSKSLECSANLKIVYVKSRFDLINPIILIN